MLFIMLTSVFLIWSQIKGDSGASFAIGLCIIVTFLVISLKVYVARRSRYEHSGSVADLVKRGQLRSDRRGMYDSNP